MNITLAMLLKIIIAIEFYFLYGKWSFDLLSGNGIEWFFLVIACYSVITYCFRDFNKFYILFFSIALGLFSGLDKNIGDLLACSRIIVFYPFFLLGTIIKKDIILKLKAKKTVLLISVFVVMLYLFLCFVKIDSLYILRHLFTGRNPFSEKIRDIGPLYRIATYFISTIIGFCLLMISPKQNIPIISKFGKNTAQVYFWHYLIVRILTANNVHIKLLRWNSYLGFVIYIIIAVLITLLLSLDVFSFPMTQVNKYISKEKNNKNEVIE